MDSIDHASAKEYVGPGWSALIDILYAVKPANVEITTVKEKFGSLRAYYSIGDGGFDQHFEPLVDELEKLSAMLCERCGKLGFRRPHGGWITTLCEDHHRERAAALTGRQQELSPQGYPIEVL